MLAMTAGTAAAAAAAAAAARPERIDARVMAAALAAPQEPARGQQRYCYGDAARERMVCRTMRQWIAQGLMPVTR
ncbi:hypothetical protein [uncultured Sphingomonas sp.]|uniref:hypothetical protein n=1 Tax=uncultured Sphingomonas sp. TaxID=158754 RepID=UPI002602F2C2|nr:hypothetical protein [uncultured Sphingomonas sp.]